MKSQMSLKPDQIQSLILELPPPITEKKPLFDFVISITPSVVITSLWFADKIDMD